MNKSESKYRNTALCMDEALLLLLQKKDFEFITVKEVCKKAGVNRSTFYLHYENMDDLLAETIEAINKRFYSSFADNAKSTLEESIYKNDKNEMILVTPKYLKPYLKFIAENKKVFRLSLAKPMPFNAVDAFSKMNEKYFEPIMNEFRIDKTIQPYLVRYYCSGIISVINKWLEGNCKESIDEILAIIEYCLHLDDVVKKFDEENDR